MISFFHAVFYMHCGLDTLSVPTAVRYEAGGYCIGHSVLATWASSQGCLNVLMIFSCLPPDTGIRESETEACASYNLLSRHSIPSAIIQSLELNHRAKPHSRGSGLVNLLRRLSTDLWAYLTITEPLICLLIYVNVGFILFLDSKPIAAIIQFDAPIGPDLASVPLSADFCVLLPWLHYSLNLSLFGGTTRCSTINCYFSQPCPGSRQWRIAILKRNSGSCPTC